MTNLNITIPLSATRAGYNPEREASKYATNKELIKGKYHYEKIMGKRKDNGALKLKELKPEHKQYVSCFINGMKGVEIAEQFNVAAITVYRVLNDPLAQTMLGEFDVAFKDEFRAMFPLVADAIRDSLEHGGMEMRLKAVDRFVKVSAFLKDGEDSDEDTNTPEIMSAMRVRMVTMLKAAADALPKDIPAIVEVEAVVVETSK